MEYDPSKCYVLYLPSIWVELYKTIKYIHIYEPHMNLTQNQRIDYRKITLFTEKTEIQDDHMIFP